MTYKRSKYVADDSTAIIAYGDDGIPYAHVTVCLAEHGLTPKDENCVFIPLSELNEESIEMIKRDLIAEEIDEITLGEEHFLLAQLRDDWREICREKP